mgnify:FL=1
MKQMTDYTEQIVEAVSELMLRFPDMPPVVCSELAEFVLTGKIMSPPTDSKFLKSLLAWCKTKTHGNVIESMFRYMMPCIPMTSRSWSLYLPRYREQAAVYERLTNT